MGRTGDRVGASKAVQSSRIFVGFVEPTGAEPGQVGGSGSYALGTGESDVGIVLMTKIDRDPLLRPQSLKINVEFNNYHNYLQ